jgi:uncharacterized membrane protein
VIRTQVCWDATVRIAPGAAVIILGQILAAALFKITLVGWLLAIAVVVPTMLFGVYMMTKGVWLLVEEAAREAIEGRPRSSLLTEE